MIRLDPAFLARPIAHRALHGAARPENSPEAIRAACDAGYGIEIDLQLSRDNVAMVFHDYDLGRLTDAEGPVRQRTAAELAQISLTGGATGVPTLAEVLTLVAGRAPLLIEIKDQDGGLGPDVGPLERATAAALDGYQGPVALMSFNPHSVALMADLCPNVARGLTTCAFDPADWGLVPAARLAELRDMPDLARTQATFISHQASDLDSPAVPAAKSQGLNILCWTIRSAEEQSTACRTAENVTFENYLPA